MDEMKTLKDRKEVLQMAFEDLNNRYSIEKDYDICKAMDKQIDIVVGRLDELDNFKTLLNDRIKELSDQRTILEKALTKSQKLYEKEKITIETRNLNVSRWVRKSNQIQEAIEEFQQILGGNE